jgi:uncharacterized membrane protein
MSHFGPAPERPTSPAARRTNAAWTVVGVLLAIGIIVPLLVFIYDQEDPTLWGFPFYYWFQFLLVPIVSILTFAAFKIAEKALAQDRADIGLPGHAREEDES